MPGRIPTAVFSRAATMGLNPLPNGDPNPFVIRPYWSRSRDLREVMEVDHIIEMQVTPIGDEGRFDNMAHLRLMDASKNGGAGKELEWNIVKMRETLVNCTGDQGWMYRLITFERIAASTSNNPSIWTQDDLIAGRHLDAYQRLGRPTPPP
jgi:hypothetical protein